MSTTLTAPTDHPHQKPPAGRRGSARAVATVLITVGGLLLLATVVTGVLSAVRNSNVETVERAAATDGVATLDGDVSSGDLTIQFGDVREATLRVTGSSAEDWRLARAGDTLSIRVEQDWFDNWAWFGRSGDTAVLTLPRGLSGLDASLDVSAGSIAADGEFDELSLELSAGSIETTGTARTLDLDVSAGDAEVDLAGIERAGVEVSAGSVSGTLSGSRLRSLDIDLSAGDLELSLPDQVYVVNSDVSAGSFDNQLRTASAASTTVDVDMSAGDVVLRPERN